MHPEIKQNWIDALRSGDFKQGRYALFNSSTNTYCCLGVLCEITLQPLQHFDSRVKLYNNEQTSLSSNFLLTIGMGDGVQKTLMSLNDLDNKSFNEIADWIEENL